jgi:hypothetical protein
MDYASGIHIEELTFIMESIVTSVYGILDITRYLLRGTSKYDI